METATAAEAAAASPSLQSPGSSEPGQTPGLLWVRIRPIGYTGHPPGGHAHPFVSRLLGRYAGWSLTQLATQDPEYLMWLSRHSSGIRYRRRIEQLLAPMMANRQANSDAGKKRR